MLVIAILRKEQTDYTMKHWRCCRNHLDLTSELIKELKNIEVRVTPALEHQISTADIIFSFNLESDIFSCV